MNTSGASSRLASRVAYTAAAVLAMAGVPSQTRAQCAGPTFHEAVSYPIGSQNYGVAAGDLDADGDVDMVATHIVAAVEGYTLAVLLNNGDGTFAAAVNFLSGPAEQAALGDLDGDGDLDVALTDPSGEVHSIVVMLNNGSGSFGAASRYAAGGYDAAPLPQDLALADLDADGDLDVAVANLYGPKVTVLKNNGDGTLTYFGEAAAEPWPRAIAAADVDGDRDVDLVVANSAWGTVSVLRNHGDGWFRPQVSYPVGDSVLGVALGDLNADGRVDIVATDVAEDPELRGVGVLLNVGGGAFAPAAVYDVPVGVGLSPKLADFDGDDDLDVVVPTSGPFGVALLLNDGAGAFVVLPGVFGTEQWVYDLAVADLNADGGADVVGLTQAFPGPFVLLNATSVVRITDQPDDAAACEGGSVTFAAGVFVMGPVTYQWRHDGSDIAGATGPSFTIPAAGPGDAGLYDLVVTGLCDPVTSDPAVMVVITGTCCRADWNADGVVNSTDVSDFISAWFEDQAFGTTVTDWDGNGVSNSTDVSAFINTWFENTAAGCG